MLGLDYRTAIRLPSFRHGVHLNRPPYFLSNSHGFTPFPAYPSVATGANLRTGDRPIFWGFGDGDTASIGMGSVRSRRRRNLGHGYLVRTTACYGLTKARTVLQPMPLKE